MQAAWGLAARSRRVISLTGAPGQPILIAGAAVRRRRLSSASKSLPFHIVDVFTTGEDASSGNQLLVVEDRSDSLSSTAMQSIAMEVYTWNSDPDPGPEP